MCFTALRSARSSVAPRGRRRREGVSIPPPYPLWTPYPPLNDQGMSPWTQMRKVAPGVWLKKLFTAHQMYCASLFPGAIRPALRLCMRALRARLGNVPNEITISPSRTKKTKCPQKGHFVVFVGFVDFAGAHFLARGARFLGAGASAASAGAAAGA